MFSRSLEIFTVNQRFSRYSEIESMYETWTNLCSTNNGRDDISDIYGKNRIDLFISLSTREFSRIIHIAGRDDF